MGQASNPSSWIELLQSFPTSIPNSISSQNYPIEIDLEYLQKNIPNLSSEAITKWRIFFNNNGILHSKHIYPFTLMEEHLTQVILFKLILFILIVNFILVSLSFNFG